MTIRTVSKSDEGIYYCKHPERGESPHSWVSVRDLPTNTLTVEPQSPVFTGESVTLKCEVQGYDGWTYQWRYKKKAQRQWTTVSQSVFDTVNRDTLTISGDAVVNGDQYQCRGERHYRPITSQYGNIVTLTVHVKPTPELTSSLTGAALVGNPVTLHCKLDQSAGWSFYWSRHTQNPENETNTAANSYNISSVAPSDGGQYWCRAGRGNPVYYTHYSDAIWLNVTAGDSSSLGLVGLAVGLSLVMFSILLTLLWCYKTNKESLCRCTGSQSDINQTSDQTQRESGEAAHIYDTAERADRSSTDEPADDLSDVTYAQVMKHNKKSRNKDTGAGPSEVTYAEVELKPKQKAKKKEEKSSVGADTVYSELRQDSHKGQSSKIYGMISELPGCT